MPSGLTVHQASRKDLHTYPQCWVGARALLCWSGWRRKAELSSVRSHCISRASTLLGETLVEQNNADGFLLLKGFRDRDHNPASRTTPNRGELTEHKEVTDRWRSSRDS